ncbi:MAG TPA: S46 family peptidase [Thermoanaerobaculia bacterium]
MKKATLLLLFLTTAAYAGEGMWMPQQIPQIAADVQKMGAKFDPNRLADLTGDPMGAVVSLGGCTASFVSPDGLIVTNHHCGFGAIQYNSTAQRDLITNGFLAKTREEELPAGPGQHVYVTTKIEDVTPRITGNLGAKLTDAEREKTIEHRTNELVAECEKPGGVRCRVASFFEGSQYLRITQLDLSDVKLVYAPANSVGDFGGDIDNFEWPRHTGDFSFLRAYVNGQPYHPAHWLKVSSEGMNDGDFVLVAGYPGRTFRYKTADEVHNYQDFIYPTSIKYYEALIAILENEGKGKRDIQIKNASRVKSLNNSLKNYQSVNEGFVKDRILASRVEREKAMVAADPNAAPVLDQIAQINATNRKMQARDTIISWIAGAQGATGLIYRSSPMTSSAVQIWRAASEKSKKDLDRAAGYHDRDLSRIRENMERWQRVMEPGSDRAGLRYFVDMLSKNGGLEFIESKGGSEKFLDWLYANTKIGDKDERLKMLNETQKQLADRHDSMLEFAAALTPVIEQYETREDATNGAMSRVRPQYFEILRKVAGGNLYPDANGTLRITFGRLEGYVPKDATFLTSQTTLNGVLQKDTGKDPFDSPKRLLDTARDPAKTTPYADPQLHSVPVDFLSTCDTTGGNSGSPTLNSKGELCGLLFDGNYESIDADFLFNPAMTRSIHVDTQYMLWVMDAVDGAQNLIREMGVTTKF